MKNNLKRTSKQDQEMESYKLTLKYFLKKFIFNNIIKYLAHEFEKKILFNPAKSREQKHCSLAVN